MSGEASKAARDYKGKTDINQESDKPIDSHLVSLSGSIEKDLSEKRKHRFWVMLFMCFYFLLVTLLVFGYIFLKHSVDNEIEKLLLGGFYVNLISLMFIILKFLFPPENELYSHMDKTMEHFQKKPPN